MNTNIPFSKKNILDKDLKVVNKILKSGWLTHGKYTEKFETLILLTWYNS